MKDKNKIYVEEFQFDLRQPFCHLLGRKATLLRRAMRQKNICVDLLPRAEGAKQRWLAKGSDKAILFASTKPLHSTAHASELTANKETCKYELQQQGVRVPGGIVLNSSNLDEARTWFRSLASRKAVVKPLVGSGGFGVTPSISNEQDLITAMRSIKSNTVILEEHIEGGDYRLLVVGGKVAAGMRRWPAHVIGDGMSTVRQLIDQKNAMREKNPYDGRYPVRITSSTLELLATTGLTADSVAPKGRLITLQKVANIGAGGEGEDVTALIHPDFTAIARRSWETFSDLECCGVDLIAEDISKPADQQDWAVIEMNADCDIPIHHWPAIGPSLNVAACIADYYFPNDPIETDYCVKVIITGDVQRVNYRRWLSRLALTHGVNGSCKNKPDGSVEAIFEGSTNAANALIRLCARGPAAASVEGVAFYQIPPRGFKLFEILPSAGRR